MLVDTQGLDRVRDSEEFRVNTHRLAQFAEALGDRNAKHATGRLAVPTFAHIPVMQSMVEIINSAAPVFALHGEHDFHFHRAIEPGMRLFTHSALIGVRGTRAGATTVVESVTRTHDGEAVCTQYTTCLMPDASVALDAGRRAPALPDLAIAEMAGPEDVEHLLDAAVTFRYADAARDYSAYTLDVEAARAVGYPAAIVHGMCAMGYACRAVVDTACAGDSARLSRLGGRFSAPLFLTDGQALTTSVWVGIKTGQGMIPVAFSTVDAEGNPTISKGFAEVRR
jgi:acyl dehydratase